MSQTAEITRDDLTRFENLLTTAIHDAAIRQDGNYAVALSVIFAEFEADFDNLDNGIVSLNDVAWSEYFTAYEALLDAKPAPVINVLTDVISARSVIGLFEAMRDGQIRLMFDDGEAIAARYLAETGITFGGGDYYEWDVNVDPLAVARSRGVYQLALNEAIRQLIKKFKENHS